MVTVWYKPASIMREKSNIKIQFTLTLIAKTQCSQAIISLQILCFLVLYQVFLLVNFEPFADIVQKYID